MANGNAEKVIAGIPEAFYDGLAYIIPAAYLALGILLNLFDPETVWEVVMSMPLVPSSWVRDLFIVIILLSGLYLTGQLLTTISDYIILKPLGFLRSINKNNTWYDDYTRIKIKHPGISLLVTKRYARWVASTNLAFASLALLFLTCAKGNWILVSILGFLFPIFLFDNITRKRWLIEYIQSILKIVEDEHSRKSTSQKQDGGKRENIHVKKKMAK